MKVYPIVTGALCANSHPGSYTGQDAFNGMLPVIERESDDLLDKSRNLPIFEGGVAASLMARDYKFARDLIQEELPMVYDGENVTSPQNRKNPEPDGPAPTLNTDSRKYVTGRKYVLRRLTPTECARLQGFPDWWTDGVEGSDSARYKMWGNGIALPCAVDVLGRIAKEIRKDV